MNDKLKKVLEIILFIAIVGLSVVIFIFRDSLQDVSNISYLGLFALCFLANATVLFPAPSLMIAASCALILNPWLVAVVASLGSTFGELVGYVFGNVSNDLSTNFNKIMDKVTSKVRSPVLIVFVFALLPLPLFDVAGIYSGGIKMNLLKFFLSCFAGKLIKMLVYVRAYDILEWAVSII